MNISTIEKISKWVKTQVSQKRFQHICGVVKTAAVLAHKFSGDKNAISTAAWLHDCTKEWPKAKMLDVIDQSKFKLDPLEKKIPALWHAHASAAIAIKKWGITQSDILGAILSHTMGNSNMSLTAKIIFIADFIEPSRDFPGVENIRKISKVDLESAVKSKIMMTISYLLKEKGLIHPRLILTWNSLIRGSK
jgi:predicted HD superfamily hydrolase involved in NAD metabolism